jgi:LPS-assembly lipoprotein
MTNTTRALLLFTLFALSACGFHLRGSQASDVAFAFKSLHLRATSETPFVSQLRLALGANKVALTAAPNDADLVLEVISEQSNKTILSLSSAGRVKEYQLNYRVALRAYDNQQRDWLPADEVVMSRILAYDDAQILAKEQEEAMLYKDMRADAVAQTLRRLSRAKPQL